MSEARLRFQGTDDGLSTQFTKANQQLNALERNAVRTNQVLSKGFSAVGATIAGLSVVRLTGELFDYNEQLLTAATSTGVQVEQLQRLQFIASQSETSVDAISSSINKFQVNLAESNDKTSKALTRLGITFEELNSLSPDQQFLRVARAVADIQSPTEQAALSNDLFSKSYKELLPLLKLGSEGIDAVDAQFDKLGITLSTQTVHKVDDAGDALGRLGSAVKALGVELLSLPAGTIAKTADGITLFFKAVAFAVRGEGGGHGENEIANVTRDLELLQDRLKFIEDGGFQRNSMFNGNALNEVIQLNAQIQLTKVRLEALTGTGLGGVSPLRALGVDAADIGLSAAAKKGLAGIDLGPEHDSAQEKRLRAGEANNPVVASAKDDNELLIELNQQKLDTLLKQEADHAQKAIKIDSDLAEFKRSVRETFGLQEITFEEGKNATLLSTASQLFGVLARENSKVAKVQQALAIATTIWDTSRAIMKALAEIPYPASLGVAALLGAQGAIQIAKIRSTNYGSTGGTVASVSGGGSTAGNAVAPAPTSTAEDAGSQSVLQVYLNGPIAGPDAARWLIDELADLINTRDVVVFSGASAQAQIIRDGQ